jgi:hypothetical protein
MTEETSVVHLQTDFGGLPIVVCACGCLVYEQMKDKHLNTCLVMAGVRSVTVDENDE